MIADVDAAIAAQFQTMRRDPSCRRCRRFGAPKAIAATPHELARIIYTLMRYGLE